MAINPTINPTINPRVGIVVIGRNEGERLLQCLKSIPANTPIVYVDSGSNDGSPAAAKALGAAVISLDMTVPFTAARARNQGWRQLLDDYSSIEFIQFIDGDCQLFPDWINSAVDLLSLNPHYVITTGRRKERFPERSIYNRLCDIEWNTPIGDAKACGGDALIRASVLVEVNGYRDDVIAGEEPEMCVRIRALGYKIYRLETDMTLHDANIRHFLQWWKRSVRCGFAYAQGAFLHGKKPERHWVKEALRACFWGGLLPLVISVLLLLGYELLAVSVVLLYCLSFFKTVVTQKNPDILPVKWQWSGFMLLSKFSEFWGVLKFLGLKLIRKKAKIIEYK
ncbi:MAG: glycosyltransferase [Marinagarivorans sp.]|nr:glycosyltransferase [Marinagarivorans sp.]